MRDSHPPPQKLGPFGAPAMALQPSSAEHLHSEMRVVEVCEQICEQARVQTSFRKKREARLRRCSVSHGTYMDMGGAAAGGDGIAWIWDSRGVGQGGIGGWALTPYPPTPRTSPPLTPHPLPP